MIAAATIGAWAEAALLLELDTWPKPGLVSRIDRGSHPDMYFGRMRDSAAAIRPHFARMAEAGRAGACMDRLRGIGIEAEAAMLRATGGVNAHRGAIFGLGLLCAAAGTGGTEVRLGDVVLRRWGPAIASDAPLAGSRGAAMRALHGAGGARDEARAGFPSLYGVGLPALRRGREAAPHDPAAARIECLFGLIAEVEDTCLLARGGAAGARFARAAARGFLDGGGVARTDWCRRAEAVHRAFVARNLSPGGCADLMAMALFVDRVEAA